nr:HNH endonuclease signature motif containing protein [Microbacterium bovistercoris]
MDELSAEGLDLPGIDALVTGLLETRRAIARLQAFEASLLSSTVDVVATCAAARGVDDDRDLPWREVSAEIGAALRMSDRTVQARLGEAAVLVTQFPATHTAWADGLLDQSRVRVIVEVGATLPDAQTRTVYEQTVLPRAAELAPGRLRPVCRTVADRVHPDSISTRHKQARQARTARVIDLDDDMSRLLLDGPATLIHAIFDRATQMARTVQQAATGSDPDATTIPAHEDGLPVGDDRTLDQLRADVLTDLLLTAAPTGHGPADAFAGITAQLQVTIPATLLHPDSPGDTSNPAPGDPADRDPAHETPAILSGYGPIDTDTARVLAAATTSWTRIFTDPHTGIPVSADRYRPHPALARLLDARDQHCRFPGCRQPVHRCDLDHTHDHALGGTTAHDNLEHLCRRHHVLKHHTRWTVRQLPRGILEWTSPTGRVYHDHPTPTVHFTPTDPPPF